MEEELLVVVLQYPRQLQQLMRTSNVLNKEQCRHITDIILCMVDGVQNMLTKCKGKMRLGQSVVDLYRIMKRIEVIIQDCCRVDWVHASLWQMDNQEEFGDVLEELKLNFDIMCGQFESMGVNVQGFKDAINFNPIKFLDVEKDQTMMLDRLYDFMQTTRKLKESEEIVQHTWKRLKFLLDGQGLELDSPNFPTYHWSPELTGFLGEGAVGKVFLGKCFGLNVALKAFGKVEEKSKSVAIANFNKEVGILAGLSHPNIVKLICCGDILDNKDFMKYIGMEKMDRNLTNYIDQGTLRPSYLVIMDIMMQMARGMFYLHDMNVAHRDLKPDNILVNVLGDSKLDEMGYVRVKLGDFGIAKIEGKDVYGEPSGGKFGTIGYRAPETFLKHGEKNRHVNPFKSDVYSFAMICADLINRKTPKLEAIQKHEKRQKLPLDIPKSLTSLLEECWALDATKRPTFEDICIRLGKVKMELLQNTEERSIGGIILRMLGRPFVLRVWLKTMLGWITFCFWYIFRAKHGVNHLSSSNSTNMIKEERVQCITPVQEHTKNDDVGKLVGMEERKLKVLTELEKHWILVIRGMGGMGKTTLATHVKEHMGQDVDVNVFVMKTQGCGALEILKETLKKLGENGENVGNIPQGRVLLEKAMTKKKTLMVLDNIGTKEQIETLVELGVFKMASIKNKMIVTTRDWGLFENVEGAHPVDMDEMNVDEAMTLFSMHVCNNQEVLEIPCHVGEIARRIVKSCNGLPLSLKVVGSTLRGMNRIRVWMRTLQRLRCGRSLGPKNDMTIWQSLQVSFDELREEDDKSMFLDICCFFSEDLFAKGITVKVETALQAWMNPNKNPRESLKRLEEKSLVKIGKHGTLEMHDHLRDMGRMIVQTQCEYSGTRSWNIHCIKWNEEIGKDMGKMESLSYIEPRIEFKYKDVKEPLLSLRLLNYQGFESLISIGHIVNHSKDLSCLLVNCRKGNVDRCVQNTNPISSVKWENHSHLKVLVLKGISSLQSLPDSISRLVSLNDMTVTKCCLFQNLPKSIGSLSSLRNLNLCGCARLENIPVELGKLTSLITLNLSGRGALHEARKGRHDVDMYYNPFIARLYSPLSTIPVEMGNLSSLTSLDLRYCVRLKEIPEALGYLTSLTSLDLRRCVGLKDLPEALGNLTSLTRLDLSFCKGLMGIPHAMGNLSALTNLDLSDCKNLKEIPEGLGNLISLTSLDLRGCESLKEIPMSVGNLTSLTKLDLTWCKSLKEIPETLATLTSLTNLGLRGCNGLTKIPKALGNFISLRNLDLNGCEGVKDLPEALGNLTSLTSLSLNGCEGVKDLPEALGNLTSLTSLSLRECKGLKDLPEGLGNLTSLTSLDLSDCCNLKVLPEALGNLTSLTSLDLRDCHSLEDLTEGFGNLISLTSLDLEYCQSLKDLPEALGNLTSLRDLKLKGCKGLKDLPKVLGNLTSFTSLNLSYCESLKEIPEVLGNLISLSDLDLRMCKSLVNLPEALGNLTSLASLYLGGCEGLKDLPKALGNLTSLRTLELSGCNSLKEIPSALGNLASLTTLDLSGCDSLKNLPDALGNLTSLSSLDVSGCTGLKEIPRALYNLTSLRALSFESSNRWEHDHFMWARLPSLTIYGCNGLEVMHEELGNLTSLTTLNLNGCDGLKETPHALGNLISLKDLSFICLRDLKEIPEVLGNLTFLTSLILIGCHGLQDLPKALGNLISLTTLNLSDCRSLKEIPEALGNLTSLTSLDLSGCIGLKDISHVLGNLTSLTSLDLSGCIGLKEISHVLGNLTSLKYLNLSGCNMSKEVLEVLGNLISLTDLNLSSCEGLKEVPEGLGNLISLDLSGCKGLKEISKALENLTSLKYLNLSDCEGLKELPKTLGNLISLEELTLNNCEGLKELPEALGNLTSLRDLCLGGCKGLKELPETLGNLISLMELDLTGCEHLKEIPSTLRDLTSMRRLELFGCEGLNKTL